jgi:tetratricopeptide (TPR) repeat protein
MFGFILRSILSLGSLFLVVYFFATGYWGWAITMIFVAAIFILTFFRNENIILALNHIRTGNQEKAIAKLNRIKNPNYLIKSQRAYYYYLRGLSGAQALSMGETEKLFRKALSTGLRTGQDQAVAKMNVAAICMGSGRKREAKTLLAEAKKLDKNGILGEQIKMLNQKMAASGSKNQMRMAQMMKGKKPRMK